MGNTTSINFAFANQVVNRYVPIPFLFFGIIGNILNILVFTRRIFRDNICVMYLLASTFSDSLVIIVGLLPRLLNGFGVDYSQTSRVLCKLRYFFTYLSGYAAAWFLGLACFERYLSSSTSAERRQWLTKKRAYICMFSVVFIGCLVFAEHFYCIDINQQYFGAPQSCFQLKLNIECQVADTVLQLLFEILFPAMMMLIFGVLTVRNIHQRHKRIHVQQRTNNTSATATEQRTNFISMNANRIAQKRDAQLLKMLLFQVTLLITFTLPISIYKLYSVATIDDVKSTVRKSIEGLIFNVSVISLFVNNTMTFYIYTLSGSIFRKELMKLFPFCMKRD